MHGVNVERFARILVKRRERNPAYRAGDLPELKSLSGYSEALSHTHQPEVCREIETAARAAIERT